MTTTDTQVELDSKCIDTIRTLCIDAIEAANSGHPGTPIGIAPVHVHALAAVPPLRPGRPDLAQSRPLRAVLGPRIGPALVDAPPHGRPGRRSRLRDPRHARSLARRPEALPAARLEGAGPSRVPLDERRGGDDRPPRDGRCHVRRHGRREPVARGAVQPRRAHALRLRRVRPGRRRLHDGGDLVRGGVVRRAPAPLEPLLDLRLEPGDHRGSHGHRVHGGRRGSVHGVRLERDHGLGRERPRRRSRRRSTTSRPSTNGRRSSSCTATSATAPTSRTRPRHTASRWDQRASRRRSGSTAGPRMRSSSFPEGVYEHFADGIGARGKEARESWESAFAEYRADYPELADEIEQMQRRELPEGWDADIPVFPADEKGIASRDSSGQVLNALAKNIPWLLGGAADLAPSTKTRLTFDGAGDFEPGERSGRNFHFGVRENASAAIANGLAALEAPPVLVRLPHLLRLRAGPDPALRADGDPGRPHLHARLDRGGRGRSDPPAGRAARVAAGDSGAPRVPARGRERGGGDMALRRPAQAGAGGARPLAAGAADRRPVADGPASEVAKGAYVARRR